MYLHTTLTNLGTFLIDNTMWNGRVSDVVYEYNIYFLRNLIFKFKKV